MVAYRVLAVSAILIFASCGCSGGQDDEGLERFEGWYDLTETFHSDQGTGCPPEPTDIFENSVDIRIDVNQFEARFSYRWDVLKGEIREDGSFLATGNMGPDKSIRFSGDFKDDSIGGLLDDISAGTCTRTYKIEGMRRAQDQ